MNVECSNCGSYFELHDGMRQKTKCPYCHQKSVIRMVSVPTVGLWKKPLVIVFCSIGGVLLFSTLLGVILGVTAAMRDIHGDKPYGEYNSGNLSSEKFLSPKGLAAKYYIENALPAEQRAALNGCGGDTGNLMANLLESGNMEGAAEYLTNH